jgi:hypothetical protein|tara:strand:+ start:105 stop:419 length:315 start_codon:yes stop_codon:yes gene_type:complete
MSKLANYVNTATSLQFYGDPDPFQVRLGFGDYEMSIVRHTGSYGSKMGLYEIGCYKDNLMVEMPGITEDGNTVKGFLTESAVDSLIIKMFTVTGKDPIQIVEQI